MLQSTTHAQTVMYPGNKSRNGYMHSIHAYSQGTPRTEGSNQDASATSHARHCAIAQASPGTSSNLAVRQKTMYKLIDTQTLLFCQGGPWPCSWDTSGKTWSSKSALRRYLRSVLARGYHLKPRAVPPQWKIVEIEEVVSYHEKANFPADVLIASQ